MAKTISRINLNDTQQSSMDSAIAKFDRIKEETISPTRLTLDQRYDSEASLVSIGSTMSVMEQPHSLAVLGNITQVCTFLSYFRVCTIKFD